jgi:hypothetical protein
LEKNAMAFVPVPNTIGVDVIYEQDGQRVENTLYFERPAGWDGSTIATFLGELNTYIQTELLPVLSTAIQLVQLVGTLLDAVDAIAVTLNISPPVSGSVTGDAMPNNVTYTIQFKTAQRGRSFRGRNYVPGLPNSAVSSNNVTSDFRTSLLAFYTGLIALAGDHTATWVVVSRVSGGVDRAIGVTTIINTPATADQVVDSQRRRLPGRGT